ncbi:unnamed protein product [Rhodiola kirilowii]
MADLSAQSHYVKLTKDRGEEEVEITPGELNQPIDVPQLQVRRCFECGQPLPDTYQRPADEDWTTGIFGCAEDPESCWKGLFCPCILFGRNVETMSDETPWTGPCVCHALCVEGGMVAFATTVMFHGIDPRTSCLILEGLFFTWWLCGIYTGINRESLQKKYHLKDSPCDPCMVHCCLHPCALCQEHREMKSRLSDNVDMTTTVINPPPHQAMSTRQTKNKDSKSSSEGREDHHASTELQLQPVS